MEFLEEFAREPRDLGWAPETETQLEAWILHRDPKNEPEKFSVRALECRTTRCVVEVVAPFEAYVTAFYRAGSMRLAGPTVGDLGFELGPAGEKVIVTALGFERH